MDENFKTKVLIKEELKKCLIFNLKARLPIGIILGFTGYRHEILHLMMNISHATRAYIVNANGLSGFLENIEIIKFLKDSDARG